MANEWFVSVCLFVCLSVSSYPTYLDRSSDRRWDENHRGWGVRVEMEWSVKWSEIFVSFLFVW